MKQKFLLFLATLLAAFSMSAEDTGYFTFLDRGQNSVAISGLGNNMWLVSVTGGDPYALLSPLEADLKEGQNTVKFEYKLSRSLGNGVEFFFSPIAGGREQQFSLEPADSWTLAQIDISGSMSSFNWGKAGDQLRFDFGDPGSGTIQIRNLRIGAYEPPVIDDLKQDENGTCLLSTAEDLATYAGYVNKGILLSAKLMNDIDYRGHTEFMGTSARHYTASFDGQGHSITLGYTAKEKYQSLFSYFGGTLKNLVVKGDIVGETTHLGCVLGGTSSGTISNCVCEVNLTTERTGDVTYGGFIGAHLSAYVYLNNCIFTGKISAPNAENIAGMVGWSDGRTTLTNCIMAADLEVGGGDCYNFARHPSEATLNNCVYTKETAHKNDGAKLLTLTGDGLKSGELAFRANAHMGTTAFYQNLGEDAFPVPFDTHKVVYAKGDVRCDGTPNGENYSFTNDPAALPPHQYEDGFCTVCGNVDMNFVPQIDGVLQIGNGKQLNWLSKYVAMGNKADAVLTADIDMAGIEFEPIGTPDKRFTGSFDGQFHRISNLTVNLPEQQGVGLFGTVTGGVVVKNVILDATCSITGKSYGGVIGCAKTSANLTISCVGNEGNVTVAEQNGGGIFGCNDGNCALVTMRNCYVTGNITSGREGGALSGWAHGASIQNCWSTAAVVGVDNEGTSMFRGDASAVNCYSTHGQCTAITQDDAVSGKLTYMLNGGLVADAVWYQTLTDDNHPVFDNTHGMVYKAGDEYGDIHDDASLAAFKEKMVAEGRAYIQELVATTDLITEYEEELNIFEGLTSIDDVLVELPEHERLRKELEASAAAYAAFKAKVEETIAYLEENTDFEGENRDELSDFLLSGDEPNDVYPNGGADYIYNTHELYTDDVKAEIASIDQMLADAIKYGYKTGSEVTSLLTNANFEDGVNGWSGSSKANGTIKSSTTGFTAAEYYGSGTVDMYQKIEGVKNGVYVLAANAACRAFNDVYSNYYNTSLYLNQDNTFVPTAYETRLPVDEAVDGVNCYIVANGDDHANDLEVTDIDGNLVAYAIHGRTSMANAASAGRAQNYLLTQVTDGTLTVGFRKLAAVSGNDWAGLSNIHLYYFATMDEAAGYMDKVLASLSARAQTIIDFEADDTDPSKKPNCPQSIKDALKKNIEAVATASDMQQKYALVQSFSACFDQFVEGRAAYLAMVKEAEMVSTVLNELRAAQMIEEAEDKKVQAVIDNFWGGYINGSFSTEEAKAMTELKNVSLRPEIVDGTCMIASDAQMVFYTTLINKGERLNAKLLTDIKYFTENQMMNKLYNVFDGNHHSITFNINATSDNAGLAKESDGGTVKNLTILGKIATANKYAAAVIGTAAGGTTTISNVASYITIETGVVGDGTHGGIVGVVNSAVNMKDCLFGGRIVGSSTNSCGGLVGWSSATCRIDNCLQVGSMETDPSGGCTFSRNMGAVIVTNSFYLNAHGDAPAGKVSQEQLASGEVCYALNNGLDLNPSWYQTLKEDATPVLDPTHKVVGKAEDGTYSNEVLSEMAKHKGTADDPYPLSNASELQAMRRCMVPGQMTYFVLTQDIDMSGVQNWEILNSEGDVSEGLGYRNYIHFDGRGHVIKNFSSSANTYPSFFGVLCGTVRNVGFENFSVTSTGTGTGLLCSHASHPNFTDADGNMRTTVIENVWVTGDITGTKSYTGGLIGRVYGPTVVKNCYANIEMTSTVDATGVLAARVTAPFTVTNFYGAGIVPEGKGLVGTTAGKADDAVATYTNVVVWNNTDKTFGALADNDVTNGISYYDGTNFAELQQTVVGWDSKRWSCTMEEGAYPVLIGLADGINAVAGNGFTSGNAAIYNLNGQRVMKMQKGIYIQNGRKVLVK